MENQRSQRFLHIQITLITPTGLLDQSISQNEKIEFKTKISFNKIINPINPYQPKSHQKISISTSHKTSKTHKKIDQIYEYKPLILSFLFNKLHKDT